MKLRGAVLVGVLIVLVVFSGRAFPQGDGVSLAIRFPGGTSQFHVGEVIPIELSFTAPRPDSYDLNTVTGDRSGRLNMEKFHVTPPGRDPLTNYYSIGGFMGGGPSSSIVLSNQPWVLQDDLNDWVVLDTPGHYTLYATSSGRVSRRTAAKDEPQELRSNSLEFDVIAADPAWQEQTFLRAVSVLNSTVSTDEEKRSAIRRLRFLDSPKSIQELVSQMGNLSQNLPFECMFGLAGSRYQAQVVHELESQMNAPDTAINQSYIYILAKLKVLLEPQPAPPYPKNYAQMRDKEFMDLEDALFDKTRGLVSIKQGRAKVETIATLLTGPEGSSHDVKPLTSIPSAEIAAAFLELPADRQSNLLSYDWERLRLSAMVKALETIAAEPDTGNYDLRDAVLRRLYELDPDQGRPYILDEIEHPHVDNVRYTVKGKTLGVLPDATLPEFDQMLAARLEKGGHTMPLDSQLVARYSTKAILPRVKAVYETAPGKWDCVTEDGLILYFLRTDPDYGVKRLAVVPSTCMPDMTESIPAAIKMKRWDEVEPSVIAQLDNPDLWRARQAAETLSKYGDDKAEAAIWDRLRRFHQQWAGHESDLIYRPDKPHDTVAAWSLQSGLVQSLGHAQGWLLSNQQLDEIENLTFGLEHEDAKMYRWNSPVEIDLSMSFDGQLQATIDYYSTADITALCAKLRQFPRGTQFKLTTDGGADRLEPAVQAIRETAAEAGLTIEAVSTH